MGLTEHVKKIRRFILNTIKGSLKDHNQAPSADKNPMDQLHRVGSLHALHTAGTTLARAF
jgi:hypothetical protein